MVFNLSEVTSLSEAYKASGLGGTWPGGFLASLVAEGKPPRGRGNAILEDLIRKGPPESWPTWAKAKEYLRVAETCTVPAEAQTLKDFAGRILSGNDLTERQKAYAEKLMAGATRTVEMVEVTEEIQKLLWGLQGKMNSTSQWYWGQRASTYNRLRAIFNKVGVERHTCNPTISKEDLDYLKGSFKGFIATWEKAPEYYGTLCQVHTSHVGGAHYPNGSMVDALVVGNRVGDSYGRIVVDCLVNGAVMQVSVDKLNFPRKPRKKKVKV
jgi:hypothetical protein